MGELIRELSPEDHDFLRRAYEHLEHPSLAARLTSLVGSPIEQGFKLLPKRWYATLHTAADRIIHKTLQAAIATLDDDPTSSRDGQHLRLGVAAGAVSGFFGLPALLIELPFTTAVMLRSIADIARAQGEDLGHVETQLSCIQVFAFGAHTSDDDAAETGYYGVRLGLAMAVSQASQHLAQHGLNGKGTPWLLSLATGISSRFGLALSEKAAAQAMPIIGAAAGAAVNAIFIQHFQHTALAHFGLRRLERVYGAEMIRQAYQGISLEETRTRSYTRA